MCWCTRKKIMHNQQWKIKWKPEPRECSFTKYSECELWFSDFSGHVWQSTGSAQEPESKRNTLIFLISKVGRLQPHHKSKIEIFLYCHPLGNDGFRLKLGQCVGKKGFPQECNL